MEVGKRLEVQGFLDSQPISPLQVVIFALCFIIVMIDGFDTAAIGYIAPSLIQEWGVARPALSPVLSAALFGLAAGALCSGPLADKFGRKALVIASVLVFGIASLLCAQATSLDHLVIWRFVTGLGLGAAMPNAVTLMSEYCPRPRRAVLVNAMFCGFPLGAAFGGFLAAWMIPIWGWRSVLVLGGVVPLVLVVLLLLLLPESARYMVMKGYPAERIRAVLSRISLTANQATSFVLGEAEPAAKGGIRLVLSRGYVLGSIMLWLTYFMGLVIFYALVNWMPVLLGDAGLSPRNAALISALFPLGGIGAVFFGWLMDRYNGNRVVALGFALTAVSLALVGLSAGNPPALMVAVFLAGVLMNTAQSSLPALAAEFYPTEGRATGVAWMIGIGRFGGIAGSFLVGELSRAHLPLLWIFIVLAVPGLIAAMALLIKQAGHPQGRPGGAPREAIAH
ncbi:aromatic acid/H+ symport family MFS transporter [Acetobacteraceae bacterium H6797]|nr:aromatic acid/H+ symport family MFS transporter [Acetobacteraceae bacterium H6797]